MKLNGRRLREARIALAISQPELARRAETSRETVSRIEREVGHKHEADTIARIAAVLDITVDSLYDHKVTT